MRHMAQVGDEPIGSMGSDTTPARSLEPAALALRLLHPALRPGDQSAARRDPRRARHLDARRHRWRGEPAERDRRALPPDRPALAGAQRRPSSRRSATSTSNRASIGFRTAAVDGLFPADGGRPAGERLGDGHRAASADEVVALVRGGVNVVISERPGNVARRRPRSRACCSLRPCTIAWSTSTCARAPRSCSKPATSAKSTTSRCCSASELRRCARTSPTSRSTRWSPRANSTS